MPTISEHDALPVATRLGEFEIQRVLGIGGFGIVYLAFDHALERQVAIKEYMPAPLASRGFGSEVIVRSASQADTFVLGMRSFINEARLLARFDHPSLVKVYRFWEAHGTAYMVMPYYKGRTLQAVRHDMSKPPDEAWLRRLITPLLGALECLHRESVYHRDVAPDNILLLDDESGAGWGHPVLLDLGAARRVIGGQTQTVTAIVKPSFAPIEQYAETVQLRQGPWTDLYALASVVHFCITGRPPMPATARTVHDEVARLREMSEGLAAGFGCHFSEQFARAIDRAMAVRPQDRPESVAAWRAELDGIVVHPTGDADAGLVPRDTQWLAEAVLLQPDGARPGQARPNFAAGEAYLTTIPAAGRLVAPPAWPMPAQVSPTIAVPARAVAPAGSEASGVPSHEESAHAPRPLAEVPFVPTFILPASRRPGHADAVGGGGEQVPVTEPLSIASNIPATVPIARPAKDRGLAAAASASGISGAVHAAEAGPAWRTAPAPWRDEAGAVRDTAMARQALPHDDADAPESSLPDTVAMRYPDEWRRGPAPESGTHAHRDEAAVAGAAPASRRSPVWLRWTFAALGLMLCTAIWWSQPRGKPMAIAETDSMRLMPSGDLAPPGAGLPSGTRHPADHVATDESPARPSKLASAKPERAARGEGSGTRRTSASDAGRQEAASGSLNPRRACGDRTFISLAICMKRHCSRPEYSGHAECARMREQEAAQRDNYYP